VIAPPSLLGCEIITEGNTCARPKADYLLLKDGTGKISI